MSESVNEQREIVEQRKRTKARTSDGAFYTTDIAAAMLARQAIRPERFEGYVKIIDPSCGTGILLVAALRELEKLPLVTGGECWGLDINDEAIKQAHENLLPFASRWKLHLHCLPHGVQPDGSARCGALELLVGGTDLCVPFGEFHLVIMNPPFTENTKRNTKYTPEEKRKMQDRELYIANFLKETGTSKQIGLF